MLLEALAVLGLSLVRVALAALTNETVSDVDGSIQYSPADGWQVQNCEGDSCPADGEQRTWHAAAYDPTSGEELTMSMNFTGRLLLLRYS